MAVTKAGERALVAVRNMMLGSLAQADKLLGLCSRTGGGSGEGTQLVLCLRI